jgi:hypothetical protein
MKIERMHDMELDESLKAIAGVIRSLANSITPLGAAPAVDEAGVSVSSATEAIMGATAALMSISRTLDALVDSTEAIAGAVCDLKEHFCDADRE